MELMNGYILIRLDEEEKQTASGILLSEQTIKLPSSGVVEIIAPEVTKVKVGDKVHFLRYASIDGIEKDTRLCTEDMIIAKL